MPGGHIGSNRNTISNALTPHKVQTLWQVWSNSCNNYLVKPLFTGREICILTGWGDTFTLAWRPYWIQSKNYFMCIDTLKGANTMAGLIKVIQQLPGKTFVSRSGNLHFHQLWRHFYACLAAILDPIEKSFHVHRHPIRCEHCARFDQIWARDTWIIVIKSIASNFKTSTLRYVLRCQK